jgi:hypothetical protein
MSDEIPVWVVERRVRNRMIEYWEWVASAKNQRGYQDAVPNVSVPNEALNQWEDWQAFPSPEGRYLPPVFTLEEGVMIARYHGDHAALDRASAQSPLASSHGRGTRGVRPLHAAGQAR